MKRQPSRMAGSGAAASGTGGGGGGTGRGGAHGGGPGGGAGRDGSPSRFININSLLEVCYLTPPSLLTNSSSQYSKVLGVKMNKEEFFAGVARGDEVLKHTSFFRNQLARLMAATMEVLPIFHLGMARGQVLIPIEKVEKRFTNMVSCGGWGQPGEEEMRINWRRYAKSDSAAAVDKLLLCFHATPGGCSMADQEISELLKAEGGLEEICLNSLQLPEEVNTTIKALVAPLTNCLEVKKGFCLEIF